MKLNAEKSIKNSTHIAIEGFDGVGKTTSAVLLAERLGFIFVEKPLKYLFDPDGGDREYVRIRDVMNEISPRNRPLSACFYGLGNMYLYEKFKGQNIITDRHILSNYAWSGSDESKELFDTIVHILGAPDYTFIVYGDEETIYTRLKSRDENDSDLKKIKKAKTIYEKMERFVKEHQMPYLLIDTKTKTPDEIVEIMLETLRKEGVLYG
jgi:thymidylate kinase